MRVCITCGRETANPKFCSRSCAAITNNHLYPRRRPTGKCSHCGKPLTIHRGICDICRARLRSWSRPAPAVDTLWQPGSRKFVLDLVGLALWWGEGSKNRQEVCVTNTDPDVILLTLRWLREVYGVPLRMFRLRVKLHKDLDAERTLRFWRRLTGIPRDQVYRPHILDRPNSKRAGRLSYGICSIKVHDVLLFDRLRERLRALRSLGTVSDSAEVSARIRAYLGVLEAVAD